MAHRVALDHQDLLDLQGQLEMMEIRERLEVLGKREAKVTKEKEDLQGLLVYKVLLESQVKPAKMENLVAEVSRECRDKKEMREFEALLV